MLTLGLSHQSVPDKETELSRIQRPLDLRKMHSGCFLVSAVINCMLFMCIYIIYRHYL